MRTQTEKRGSEEAIVFQRWLPISRVVFAASLFLSLVVVHQAAAQNCPPQPPPASQNSYDPNAWAQWVNNCAPAQAMMQQTVGLGTFEAAPPPYQGIFWNPDLVPCVLTYPVGGTDRACKFPPPAVLINSYNVQYQIAIRDNLGNSGLKVVLTVPTLHGSKDYTGSLDSTGTLATVSFHPDIIGTQELKFIRGGTKVASYKINTTLQPQLGAFVVPYLPVAVIYQPPGTGSTATYTTGQSIGTTLCWGTSATSGNIRTEEASLFFGNRSELVKGISDAAGVAGNIPGPTGTAATVIGGILNALDSSFHIQTTTTSTQTQGQTLCKGSEVSISVGHGTEPGHGDLYLLLKNALFAYVVVLKDPASGLTVPTNGVPTVIVTLVNSTPLPAVYMEDLQRDFPAAVVDQFRALDLQLNTGLLKNLMTTQTRPPNAMGLRSKSQGQRLKHLTKVSPQYCSTNSPTPIMWEDDFYASSDVSLATTTTITTNVTGYLASLYGQAGQTTQSVTLSTDQTNWQKYTEGSEISLLCPEINPPYLEWQMEIYLDTVFGTLLAVPGPKSESTNPEMFAGTAPPNSMVTLKIGGKTYRAFTDANGEFVFRAPSLPKGNGVVLVGNKTFPITYNGTPQTHLNLSLSKGGGHGSLGKPGTAEGALPAPAKACCEILSVDARAGLVEAKEKESGRVFKFEVKDVKSRSSLKVGQMIYANFKTREVSLDGRAACCSITALPEIGPLRK
jgi:hypothetical protein